MKDVMDPWKYWGYDLAELCDCALVNLDNAKEIDEEIPANAMIYMRTQTQQNPLRNA